MQHGRDLSSTRASLAAGIAGAVMIVLVCFGIAFTLTSMAGATTGMHSPTVAQEAASD